MLKGCRAQSSSTDKPTTEGNRRTAAGFTNLARANARDQCLRVTLSDHVAGTDTESLLVERRILVYTK
jgi:hypothetical protein